MHVIFAAMLLAQIHTGADLLAACSDKDTTACDAFIHQVVTTSNGAACFAQFPAEEPRAIVLQELRASQASDLEHTAAPLVDGVLSGACSEAE